MIFFFIFLMFGCNESSKLIVKQVFFHNTTITWYRESYISTTRAFVSVKFDGNATTVLSCNDSKITDVRIVNNTIEIDAFDLTAGDIYYYRPSINNYKVTLKAVSFDEWNSFYHPELDKQER